MRDRLESSPHIQTFCSFIQYSKRGVGTEREELSVYCRLYVTGAARSWLPLSSGLVESVTQIQTQAPASASLELVARFVLGDWGRRAINEKEPSIIHILCVCHVSEQFVWDKSPAGMGIIRTCNSSGFVAQACGSSG